MQLDVIDWAVIAAYLGLTITIGLSFAHRAGRNVEEFFLAGRKLPWYLAGGSMMAGIFVASLTMGWVTLGMVEVIIFSHDGARDVHLPAGPWVDFWTGQPVAGGREIHVKHPLDSFPLFVRSGGIVPMELSPIRAVPGKDDIEVRLFGPGDNTFRLHDHGRACTITTHWSPNSLEISLDPTDRPFVVLHAYATARPVAATFIAADGQAQDLILETREATWTTRVPGQGGKIRVQFAS